jgi:hypothetical protein
MSIYQIRQIGSIRTPDDSQVFVIRRDLSGGVNSRQAGSLIGENQSTVLLNADIGTAGQCSKRPGSVQIANDIGTKIVGLHAFEIQGETDQLLAFDGSRVWKWNGSDASWASLASHAFTASTDVGMINAKESGLAPDDIVWVTTDGGSNPHRLDSDGVWQDLGATSLTSVTAPPNSLVNSWYGNRIWVLKNDQLYFSDAYDSDYSTAFDTVTNVFRIPVGEERGIVPTRDTGMIIMGREAIWGIAPSATPAVDIYYFAQDGFRALRRTVQDKLQAGVDYPLSYFLKDEFDRINFTYIERLSMQYFDNKIFIAVPTGATTFDTWVYYPESKSFTIIQGWTPACLEVYKIAGQEYLYYGKLADGIVYKAWSGYTDEGTTTINGTAISYQEEGRKEDCGQPLVKKTGGIIRIKAVSSGDYNLNVYASIDDGAYVTLGTINLTGNSPTLPVNLPFTLASANIITQEFHIDNLEEWNQIRIKITHTDKNGSDDITVLERSVITYALTYQDEV